MKKYVVLSVNENPKYLFYTPLVCWAWRKFGWEPIVFNSLDQWRNGMFPCTANKLNPRIRFHGFENRIKGYKSETIAQVSRLFGACVQDEGLLMTSDIDMLPLSDYWQPKEGEITCYGRDLTDYHFPMCYICMDCWRWADVMDISSTDYNKQIANVLRMQSNMWVLDQDIITERLLSYDNQKIIRIDRGTDKKTGYPIGRVDRSAWHLNHDQYIDAHLPHDILTNENSYKNVMELLIKIWPSEDFGWFEQYYRDFKRLL